MHLIQNISAAIFIGSIALLSFVSVLGVWDVFSNEVITKSFLTIGLLAIVAVVIIIAGRYVDKTPTSPGMDPPLPPPGAAAFRSIRQIMLGVLIVSAALLALLGVLAIWDVISDKTAMYKSLASLAILGFSSLITVMVCLERENNQLARRSMGPLVVVLFVVGWIMLTFMRFF
ncbi:MAG: hypothetical protein JWO84_181 [Parcubacteria group bacterium]|nr:hypothetical protein [Parcubacteria group bacterium]